MIVACVLRSGGDYRPEHVAQLRDSVTQWLPSARFVCLSDCDVPCERIPLITNWPGWLAKLELFRPGLFDDTVLYLDLDTLIVGSLDDIVAYPHRFTMLSDFNRPDIPASGVMAWRGDYRHLFREFHAGHVPFYRRYWPHKGDAGWIVGRLRDAPDRFDAAAPGRIVSYKSHVVGRGVPPNASIVCFHGRPRPWEVDGATLAPAPSEATALSGASCASTSCTATCGSAKCALPSDC